MALCFLRVCVGFREDPESGFSKNSILVVCNHVSRLLDMHAVPLGVGTFAGSWRRVCSIRARTVSGSMPQQPMFHRTLQCLKPRKAALRALAGLPVRIALPWCCCIGAYAHVHGLHSAKVKADTATTSLHFFSGAACNTTVPKLCIMLQGQ